MTRLIDEGKVQGVGRGFYLFPEVAGPVGFRYRAVDETRKHVRRQEETASFLWRHSTVMAAAAADQMRRRWKRKSICRLME